MFIHVEYNQVGTKINVSRVMTFKNISVRTCTNNIRYLNDIKPQLISVTLITSFQDIGIKSVTSSTSRLPQQ